MKKIDFILIHASLQNKITRQRINYGLKLYNELSCPNIIIAGEIDHANTQHIKKVGISKDKIYEEINGKNTHDCTMNSFKKIILKNKWKNGIIVSSLEHLPRVLIQITKIMKEIGEVDMELFYSGPSIKYSGETDKVIEDFEKHEVEGIKYTLRREDL